MLYSSPYSFLYDDPFIPDINLPSQRLDKDKTKEEIIKSAGGLT
jgi:hypothetical protein